MESVYLTARAVMSPGAVACPALLCCLAAALRCAYLRRREDPLFPVITLAFLTVHDVLFMAAFTLVCLFCACHAEILFSVSAAAAVFPVLLVTVLKCGPSAAFRPAARRFMLSRGAECSVYLAAVFCAAMRLPSFWPAFEGRTAQVCVILAFLAVTAWVVLCAAPRRNAPGA